MNVCKSDLLALLSILILFLFILLMAGCSNKILPVCRPDKYDNCYFPETLEQWIDLMNKEEQRQINDMSRRYGLWTN